MLRYVYNDTKNRKSYFYDSKSKKLRFVKSYMRASSGYKMLGIYIIPVLLKVFGVFDRIIFFHGWGTSALELFSITHRTPILLFVFFPTFLVFLWECNTYIKESFDAPVEEYYVLEKINERQKGKKILFLFWLFSFVASAIVVHIVALEEILFYYGAYAITGMEFAHMLILDNPFIKVVREKSGYGLID